MNRRGLFAVLGAAVVGLGFGVKGYAQGGVASHGAIGLTGERGPEYVLPGQYVWQSPDRGHMTVVTGHGGGSGISPFKLAVGQGVVIGSGGGGGSAWPS